MQTIATFKGDEIQNIAKAAPGLRLDGNPSLVNETIGGSGELVLPDEKIDIRSACNAVIPAVAALPDADTDRIAGKSGKQATDPFRAHPAVVFRNNRHETTSHSGDGNAREYPSHTHVG